MIAYKKTMRKLYFALFFILLGLGHASQSFAMQENIAVIVNNEAITVSDVRDRMKLIMNSSGLQDTEEIRERLRPQIINVLIEEQLKLQEAEKLEIEVSDEDIEAGFESIAQRNNMEPDRFRQALKQAGIDAATMERQIKSQIAWNRVVRDTLRPRITVRDNDVEAELERMKSNIGKTEYLVAEIFLRVEEPEQSNDVRRLAERLVSQIRAGQAPFFKVAQQFSQSAGASTGGDIGWIEEGQSEPAIDDALKTLQKDSISDPVKTFSGYHILLLRDKRTISEDTLPAQQALTNSIGIERLERLQRRYLMDLKASAFIENRV